LESHTDRYTLYFGMWKLYGEVVEGKHAVERLSEEDQLATSVIHLEDSTPGHIP
jgi:hypothetical protein